MAKFTVKVEGAREADRALKAISKDVQKEMRAELAKAAEPVRSDAERRATSEIRNIGPDWNAMRLGVTGTGVYMAPKRRRRGGSPRPNLGGLLLFESMIPAATFGEPLVAHNVERWLDHLVTHNGF